VPCSSGAALSWIYITGGYTDLLFSVDHKPRLGLRPSGAEWDRVADLPAPPAAHCMAAIDGKCSGRPRGSDSEDLWIYDPAKDRWDVARVARPS
jgi:hypothetical protein